MTHTTKKLIEVALPLEAINIASAREKSIRHGHPSTLHLWWARRPLAAARAVIFAQMVDDPSAHPDLFPTPKAQEKERQRLFKIIEELVKWENTTNEKVLQQARDEIWQSWRYACAANADHPRARELFDRYKLPAFHDPFAGGGALPLEAQRLGLEAYASDLNPVAVLINKAMIEIPPKFAGRPPVNQGSRREEIGSRREEIGNRQEEVGSRTKEERDAPGLQGFDRLAEGDGGGTRSVSAGAALAQGGDIRDALSDHARRSLDSSQHSRGMGQRIGTGESPFSGNSAGIIGGKRDAADPLRASGLVPGAGDTEVTRPVGRGGANAHDAATEFEEGNRGEEIGNRWEEIGSRDGQGAGDLPPISYPLFPRTWTGAQGLAEDVRYYGKWMRDEAEKRIGHLYPKIEITAAMVDDPDNPRPDLKPLVGQKLTVIAWLWARTVKSPNPAFADVDVPLASTFMLSTKPGKEAYVEPVIVGNRGEEIENRGGTSPTSYFLSPTSSPGYRFTVKVGKPQDVEAAKNGTKLARGANFRCLMSGTPISGDHIKGEGLAGRMSARLMAIVAEGNNGRVYLSPTPGQTDAASQAQPEWKPETPMPIDRRWFSPPLYGMPTYGDIFTPRQLVALTTFSGLVQEARERVRGDAVAAGLADDGKGLDAGGTGAQAYADAVAVYLAMSIDKATDYNSGLVVWSPTRDQAKTTFTRQALPMVWDYCEINPFAAAAGDISVSLEGINRVLAGMVPGLSGRASQYDAQKQDYSAAKVISTDPPYYDNIGYADLSDFFYVWLRRSLRPVFPTLFATLSVPKAEELVATPYRHGSKIEAEAFFLDGMTKAMHRLAEQAHDGYPITIYYAFKQSETETDGTSSTGWETFLEAVISAGLSIGGTWPIRTERGVRSVGIGTNALASSIVLVCRKRPADAPIATRRDFIASLKAELPAALAHLQRANIAPVDLAQAAIGPGMAVYTRYAQVLDAAGSPLTVRQALALINQTLDEALAAQEGDFDADSRWALAWFEQAGFADGDYGVAETLSKAKNTSVAGMVNAGILLARAGKVRLLRPDELPADWDPAADKRLTAWEAVHHLVRALETGGEVAAGALVARLGSQAEAARELAYRLYAICERKKRAALALSYNGLVQSWPEVMRLAQGQQAAPRQASLLEG